MLDHHSFWIAGGAGCINDISKMGGVQGNFRFYYRLQCNKIPLTVQLDLPAPVRWNTLRFTGRTGYHYIGTTVFQYIVYSVGRIGRIDGNISAAGFQYTQYTYDHIHTSLYAYRYQRFFFHTCLY